MSCIYVSIFTYTHYSVPQKTSPGFLKHHMKHDQFSRTISGTNAADAEAVGALSDSRRSGASGAGDAIFRPAKIFDDSKNLSPFLDRKKPNIWRLKICGYQFGIIKVGTRFSVKFGIDRCMESDLELSSGSKLHICCFHTLWMWVGCLLVIPCTPVVAEEKLGLVPVGFEPFLLGPNTQTSP